MRPVIGRTGYPLELRELEPHEEVRFGGYAVAAFPVDHRVTAFGYAFVEDDRPGRFDAAAARALGVPEGPDFGRLQRGEEVAGVRPEQVVGPIAARPQDRRSRATRARSRRPRCTRTAPTCSCTRRRSWRTSARVRARRRTRPRRRRRRSAKDAGVRLLALTHLSTRYFPRDVRDEARATFPATVVPRDFDAIDVPFPERGEPALVKAERESRRRARRRANFDGGIEEGSDRRSTPVATAIGVDRR